MRILAIPNWSLYRQKTVFHHIQDALHGLEVKVHYCAGDLDHNRTVTAYSGSPSAVFETTLKIAEIALPSIDLNHHLGVHPRIGGLDVCPFVLLEGDQQEALKLVELFAADLSRKFDLPIFLYEQSERGIHPFDLPTLRKGGFGGLLAHDLQPDFGPTKAHPTLGATVLGLRGFLIALNVNLGTPDLELANNIAKKVRKERRESNPLFTGVRCLGFPLVTRKMVQVSMNLTEPNLTPIDPLVDWVIQQARMKGVVAKGTELIGVIRPRDMEFCTSIRVSESQIVE